jgi:pimeloyl-ACP methyl ester carboxylesterase
MKRSIWMALLAGCATQCCNAPSHAQKDSPDDAAIEFTLNLEDGRLLVRDLVQRAAPRLVADHLEALQDMDWSIDVQSLAGRVQIDALERLTGGMLDIHVTDTGVCVRINAPDAGEVAQRSQRGMERWLTDVLQFDNTRDRTAFGLSFITATDARARAVDLPPPMRQRVAVLVHGLDDPGLMWADIVPALHEAGFTVARFDYPDDGPIAVSADLLASELAKAHAAGIARVDIVAHSMGGLVVRDVLTRQEHYAGDGSGRRSAGRLPAIDRLIMLGTPNHGAEIARMRGVIELREHLFSAIATGRRYRELSRQDGSGEAGADLLPRSAFLRQLNARPLPSHTRCTIVAARLASKEDRIAQGSASIGRRMAHAIGAEGWWRKVLVSALPAATQRVVRDVSDDLGDGCVSIKSATLEGVNDLVIVNASHIGLILNPGGRGDQPPGIPIVLERLNTPRESDERR